MKIEVEIRTHNISLAGWRAAYHSDAFSRMVVANTNLRRREVVERVTLPDGKERRRTHIVPDIDLPRVIVKLIGGAEIAYDEISVYDPAIGQARLDIDSAAGDAVRVGGDVTYHVEDGGVRMRFSGTVEVKVFAIGGLIERRIVSEVKKRYAALEPLLQAYADEQSAS